MNWMPRVARIGYAAKGMTYVMIALLALQAATGSGDAESTHGALRSLNDAPVGKLLLLAIAAGLGAYAMWKLYVAIDANGGWGRRSTAVVVAFTNGGFAVEAAKLGLSLGESRGGDTAAHWSGVVMSHQAGAVAVGLAGACVAAYGISQLVRALRRRIDDHLRRMNARGHLQRLIIMACKFGMGARGIVFMLVGWFLVRAALTVNPAEARDFGHSLNELRVQPLGRLLLLVVALGLLAYAGYQFLRARFERFDA